MVSVNEAFPNKYLKADDLKGREVTVVIQSADIETVGQKDRKIVMYFRGKEKGMVCNKTNANRIAFSYGDDTDAWIGKSIILYGEVVDFQGKPTLGLRVRVPSPTAAAPAHQPTVQHAPVVEQASRYKPLDDLDDEIGF